MATAEQIKTLIRSHFSDDPERFFTIALQVAAHEAGQGHGALAHEIRGIVDKARKTKGAVILKFPQDLRGLVLSEEPKLPKAALVMPAALLTRIERVIHEYRQQHKLKSHGLSQRRKLMLVGPPGTGKTMTSRVLAHELRLPLHTIQVDRLVTRFMGVFPSVRHVQDRYRNNRAEVSQVSHLSAGLAKFAQRRKTGAGPTVAEFSGLTLFASRGMSRSSSTTVRSTARY